MLFVVDPVPTLGQDLRALPPALGQPLFVGAVRHLRGLSHTPEGAWEAYREGRCLPSELRAIERALIQRFALLGDAVNAASRLEGLNKKFQSNIIISDSTKRHLTIEARTHDLGPVTVEGREEPIRVHRVEV